MAVPTQAVAFSNYLKSHVETERELLDEYERLVEGSSDEFTRYLAKLILDDERRHHKLFRELSNTVESSIHWEAIEPRLPKLRTSPANRDEMLEATRRLLDAETEDRRELKQLKKHLRRTPGDRQLWALLVETAELDTQKHIRILKFIEHVLKSAP